jgi:hypothetical protein
MLRTWGYCVWTWANSMAQSLCLLSSGLGSLCDGSLRRGPWLEHVGYGTGSVAGPDARVSANPQPKPPNPNPKPQRVQLGIEVQFELPDHRLANARQPDEEFHHALQPCNI